jgi:hypothetical protein
VPVSVRGCPKGLIRATLDGQTWNGGVAEGGAFYVAGVPIPSLNLPAIDTFTIGGIASDGSQMTISARAKTGAAPIGEGVIDPELRNVSPNAAQLVFPATGSSNVGAGWLTSVAGGTGTVTVDSVSRSSVSGSFTLTMVATGGTPATGTRRMTGTFSATF